MNAKKAKKIRRQFRQVATERGIVRNDVVSIPHPYREVQRDKEGKPKLDAKGQVITTVRYAQTVENRGYRRAYQEAKKAVKGAEGVGLIPRGGESLGLGVVSYKEGHEQSEETVENTEVKNGD